MTAFAEAADLLQRYDYRLIGQLISDTGIAENEAAVIANPITDQMLADASGLIVASALKGGRYTELDLDTLTGNGEAFLLRLTCDIALYYFVLRRGLPVEPYPQVVEALALLEQLATGQVIFPVPAVIEAGVAQSPDIGIQTIVDNNFLVDSVRYFPTPRLTQGQLG